MKRISFRISKYNGFLVLAAILFTLISVSVAQAGPCIDVTKFCTNASRPGMPIEFFGTVANCAYFDIENVTVVDDHAGLVLEIPLLLVHESVDYSGSYIPTESPSTNVVTATGETYWGDINPDIPYLYPTDTANATCIIEGAGNEGCTPGFWKNHMGCVKRNCPKGNWDAWAATGYSPDDDFDTTFGIDIFDPDITLGDAIKAKGGGVNKLARHGTAALLSSAHPGVDYALSVAEVIIAVQNGDSELLVGYNELGCPL